jgi:two-component system sensor histidine kinase KdpD
VILGTTLPALFIGALIGYRAIALLYLLVVVLMALFVGRGPTLFGAALSALFWDFFFLSPITHLRIARVEDAIQFGMYFVVALVLGELTARIRRQERAARLEETRATALYLLLRELTDAITLDELVKQAVRHLEGTFGVPIAILLPDSSQELSLHPHAASTYDIAGPEQPTAKWVFENAQWAGRLTAHWPNQETLFVPLLAAGHAMGVAGLHFGDRVVPTPHEHELLQAIAQQIGLLLDRQRLRDEAEQAKLVAESERLSKNLLHSISHEIRTPLAALAGAVDNLLDLDRPPSAAEQALLAEIRRASERLNRLVGKVLDVNRIESGRIKPNLSPCDVSDLVHMAVKETQEELAGHRLSIALSPALPLVRMDFVLMQHALMNLLSNAALHTPPGTAIQLSARIQDRTLSLVVADRGPGLAPESLPRLFDKFYRGPKAPTGGTGLGLSLVKGFVEAQGGQVTAGNRSEGGAAFTITLPMSDILRDTPLDACEGQHLQRADGSSHR